MTKAAKLGVVESTGKIRSVKIPEKQEVVEPEPIPELPQSNLRLKILFYVVCGLFASLLGLFTYLRI